MKVADWIYDHLPESWRVQIYADAVNDAVDSLNNGKLPRTLWFRNSDWHADAVATANQLRDNAPAWWLDKDGVPPTPAPLSASQRAAEIENEGQAWEEDLDADLDREDAIARAERAEPIFDEAEGHGVYPSPDRERGDDEDELER